MQEQPDYPFCEIIGRGDPDAREVYQDWCSVAFFPTEPAVLGHSRASSTAHRGPVVPGRFHGEAPQPRHLADRTRSPGRFAS